MQKKNLHDEQIKKKNLHLSLLKNHNAKMNSVDIIKTSM